MRPPISTADLLRAFEALQPSNDVEKSAIAQMLGLEWKPVAALNAPVLPAKEDVLKQGPVSATSQVAQPPAPKMAVPVTQPSGKAGRFKISGPVKHTARSPLWATPKSSDAFESVSSLVQREVPPLFMPRWTRSIMSTALAVRTPTGQVDIHAIVEAISCGRLLRTLPRLNAMAMASQVEILVDVGHSMLPFATDQQHVIKAVRTVVGVDYVRVLKFTGSPLRGAGTDDMLEWPKYYSFPSAQTHILLLSDIGIGRSPMSGTSASVDEWRRFGRELRRRQIACTAFIPYPAKRWPPALMHQLRMVEWDRTTTTGQVRFSTGLKNA